MPGYIHHVEWCVSDLKAQVTSLVSHYGFNIIGRRFVQVQPCWNVEQVIVQSGATVFVLTQKLRRTSQNVQAVEVNEKDYPVLTCCGSENDHKRDTVFNVSLSIGHHVLDHVTGQIKDLDGPDCVIIEPIKLSDDIRLSVVKSCCGNVIHTLIDKKSNSDFDSDFLPGFKKAEKNNKLFFGQQVWSENSLRTTHMDHVTYVCHPGESRKILNWYGDIFKMKRFLVSRQESLEDDGVEIGHEVNMRLTVGEWLSSWMCREEGVEFSDDNDMLNFKLVLAEPLDNSSDSHVQKFLDQHGGPGLQHIGLTTPNASLTVQIMANHGAQFRKPPPTYYQLESKIDEIIAAGEDIKQCSSLGLLFDAEADHDTDDDRYLVQIFTKPLFGSQDTFFLEVLERRGARGFGAGNITALAQSIILYQKQQHELLV